MSLHFRDNLKVHFAGAENSVQFCIAMMMGVRYFLYTAFPFIDRRISKKATSPVMPMPWMRKAPNVEKQMVQYIEKNALHVIQDSGLFTLLFGARSGGCDKRMMQRYYDALIEFINENIALNTTCVECDCQNLFGVDFCWEYRERMRRDIKNRIINVFHPIDGKKGLDRIIEYSDYIGIPGSELRINGDKEYIYRFASYIKNKKPSIDIHLLGCTDPAILKKCKFCTSSDSVTWTIGKRFGMINKKHVSRIKTEKIKTLLSPEDYQIARSCNSENSINATALAIEYEKRRYQSSAGEQDYFAEVKK